MVERNVNVGEECQRCCNVLSSWTGKQSEETIEYVHRLFSYPLTLGMNLLGHVLIEDRSDEDIEKILDMFFKDFLIVGVTGESCIENSKGEKMMRTIMEKVENE